MNETRTFCKCGPASGDEIRSLRGRGCPRIGNRGLSRGRRGRGRRGSIKRGRRWGGILWWLWELRVVCLSAHGETMSGVAVLLLELLPGGYPVLGSLARFRLPHEPPHALLLHGVPVHLLVKLQVGVHEFFLAVVDGILVECGPVLV